jgi:hypothetical protein
LFVRVVCSKLFGFHTQANEETTGVQIHRALYPEASASRSSDGGPPTAFSGPSQSRPQLSEDARFVRDIVRVLKNRGVPESSCWRFVNRDRPEWTRERWDAALLELDPTRSPVVGSLVGLAAH